MELIYTDQPGSIPAQYQLPAGLAVKLESVSATFNGAAASGTFLACLSAYSQDGKLIGRWFPSQQFATGDSGEVSYGPFLGGTQAGGGAVPVAFSSFAEAAGFITVTNTNLATPQTVVTSPSVVADGSSYMRVDFSVAAVDISVTGTGSGAALVLSLLRDSTIIGIVSNYNVVPTNGVYGSIPVTVSAFDLPTAGSHTYTMGATKVVSGGATATMRIYGDSAGSPYTSVTHPGFIGVTQVST